VLLQYADDLLFREPPLLHLRISFRRFFYCADLKILNFIWSKLPRAGQGHSSINVTFDTYGHLFPGRGKEASARYEKSMADAGVRHKAEASVSNPLAIDGEERRKGSVTNCERPET
jgi:hypothetical protein